MKRLLSVLLIVVMLFALSATAMAGSVTFIGFVLENGVNGKRVSGSAEKAGETGTQFNLTISSISGATKAEPMVCNVYNANNKKVSAKAGNISRTGSWDRDYAGKNGAKGIKGNQYHLKMQNTTGGPEITVTGTLTP